MSLPAFGSGDVFVVAWALFILAVVVTAIEGIAVSRLQRWAFHFGIPVLRLHRSLPALETITPAQGILSTENTSLRLGEKGSAIFTGRAASVIAFRTPFPLKGSVHQGPDGSDIVARVPVGPTLVVLAWAAMMAASGSIATLVIAGVIVLFLLRFERARALRLVEELAQQAPRSSGGV